MTEQAAALKFAVADADFNSIEQRLSSADSLMACLIALLETEEVMSQEIQSAAISGVRQLVNDARALLQTAEGVRL